MRPDERAAEVVRLNPSCALAVHDIASAISEAVGAETEACARIAEARSKERRHAPTNDRATIVRGASVDIALAIRARSSPGMDACRITDEREAEAFGGEAYREAAKGKP